MPTTGCSQFGQPFGLAYFSGNLIFSVFMTVAQVSQVRSSVCCDLMERGQRGRVSGAYQI